MTNETPQINTVHTSCKNCVFAKYENNTQTGCELNYLSVYKNKDISIVEAYDNEKEFFIVNGKKCIGYRENKWFDQFNLEDDSLQSKIDIFKKHNSLDYLLTINLKNMNISQLESLLSQIQECSIKPKKLIIIRYADNNNRFPYNNVKDLLDKYSSYIWKIQTILDPLLEYKDILSNIVSLNSNRFIASIKDYNSSLNNIIQTTNKIVHEDLDQFTIISNADKTTLIFSRALYSFEAFDGKNLLDNDSYYKIV